MSHESEKVIQQAVSDSLKRDFIKTSWWNEVHDDVKTRLNWLVDNIVEAGPLFSNSFMSLFRWEFERRKLEGNNSVANPMVSYFSTMMGMRVSEEAYQCGLLPARSCLNLYDWIDPNDADVAACLMFCHKVEVLEKSGILTLDAMEFKTSPSEVAKLLRSRKTKRANKIQEESIEWLDEPGDEPI